MRILMYLLMVIALCGAFQLGGMAARRSREWSMALAPEPNYKEPLRKSFFYGGKFLQVVAAIWGFVDVVAIMVLVAAIVF